MYCRILHSKGNFETCIVNVLQLDELVVKITTLKRYNYFVFLWLNQCTHYISQLTYILNGCVVKDVYKQNECTMKSVECKTGSVTCVTNLQFCTKSLENSPHACENSTTAIHFKKLNRFNGYIFLDGRLQRGSLRRNRDEQAWWRENVEAFVHLRAARSRLKNPITPQYGGENHIIQRVR